MPIYTVICMHSISNWSVMCDLPSLFLHLTAPSITICVPSLYSSSVLDSCSLSVSECSWVYEMAQLRGSSCEDTQEMKLIRGDPRYLQGKNYREYNGDTEMQINRWFEKCMVHALHSGALYSDNCIWTCYRSLILILNQKHFDIITCIKFIHSCEETFNRFSLFGLKFGIEESSVVCMKRMQ